MTDVERDWWNDWPGRVEPPLYDSREYWQSTAVTAFRMLLEEYGRRKEAQDEAKELAHQVMDLESREVPKPMTATRNIAHIKELKTALDEALTERQQLADRVKELEKELEKVSEDFALFREGTLKNQSREAASILSSDNWRHIKSLSRQELELALDEALTERAQLQVDVNELEGLLAKEKRIHEFSLRALKAEIAGLRGLPVQVR